MNHIQMWVALKKVVELTIAEYRKPENRPKHHEIKGQLVFENGVEAFNGGKVTAYCDLLERMQTFEGKQTKSPLIIPKGVPVRKH